MSEKRKRRWWEIGLMALPAIIVLPPLLALMVVGSSEGSGGGFSAFGLEKYESFQHGWPFTFLDRTVHEDHTSRWAFWSGTKKWKLAGAAGDAAIFVVATSIVITLSIRRARQNRVWRRTIRECMSCTMIIGIIAAHLGWYVRRGEQANAVGLKLQSLGSYVDYEYCGPKWLQRIRGTRFDSPLRRLHLSSIRSVDLGVFIEHSDIEAAYRLLADVDRPHQVSLDSREVNEPLFQLLLESLSKCQPEVIDFGSLKLESFMDEPWSAELLEPLARNPRLRKLDFLGTGIGDQEIPAFLQCRQLRSIDLRSTKVTAKGVRTLLALSELEEIFISETAASPELRERASAAGVRLEVEVLEPYSPSRINPGAGMFGGAPPDPANGAETKK